MSADHALVLIASVGLASAIAALWCGRKFFYLVDSNKQTTKEIQCTRN